MLPDEAFERPKDGALGDDLLLRALVHHRVVVSTTTPIFARLNLEEVLGECVRRNLSRRNCRRLKDLSKITLSTLVFDNEFWFYFLLFHFGVFTNLDQRELNLLLFWQR